VRSHGWVAKGENGRSPVHPSLCWFSELTVCVCVVELSSQHRGHAQPPGTPRDDGEIAGNFSNPFQSESVS
ncbi:unnamed protein product, partial [Tetraodon nigroviridis]